MEVNFNITLVLKYLISAMILNLILRTTWMLSISPNIINFFGRPELFLFVIGALEIFRRGLWNFFRVEREHLANLGQFKAVHSLNLPNDASKFDIDNDCHFKFEQEVKSDFVWVDTESKRLITISEKQPDEEEKKRDEEEGKVNIQHNNKKIFVDYNIKFIKEDLIKISKPPFPLENWLNEAKVISEYLKKNIRNIQIVYENDSQKKTLQEIIDRSVIKKIEKFPQPKFKKPIKRNKFLEKY